MNKILIKSKMFCLLEDRGFSPMTIPIMHLSMAYSAVDVFRHTNDGFDSTKWKEFRKVFEAYVVVD